ncbi:hypothetical protein [Bacillus kwashiorkori]|uniref:hypothetical protein n=1 Tax=Bacillus kwashiorkori TaxID=1522318 RepID=UPI0007851E0F|nr:hypothetical protein [Bacillus kwashiorkori]
MTMKSDKTELISLLKQLPSIADHREKEELFKQMMSRMNRTKRKKTKNFLAPSLAAVAVIFLSILLSTSFLSKSNVTLESQSSFQENDSGVEIALTNEEKPQLTNKGSLSIDESESKLSTGDHQSITENNHTKESFGLLRNEIDKSALYKNDLQQDETSITLGIPDKEAMNVIPVTVVVNKHQDKTIADYYNEVMKTINEEKLGLSDYLPYNGEFSMDKNGELTLNLFKNHAYTFGSTGELQFFASLDMLRYASLDQIKLTEESVPGVYFTHIGKNVVDYEITKYPKRGFLLYIVNNHYFLTPNPKVSDTVSETLELMKEANPTYKLLPTIPKQMNITAEELNEDELAITFQNATLKNNESSLRMVEAILLTAKEFGYKMVRFNNGNINQIGDFDLTKPVEVPIAPNKVNLD